MLLYSFNSSPLPSISGGREVHRRSWDFYIEVVGNRGYPSGKVQEEFFFPLAGAVSVGLGEFPLAQHLSLEHRSHPVRQPLTRLSTEEPGPPVLHIQGATAPPEPA